MAPINYGYYRTRQFQACPINQGAVLQARPIYCIYHKPRNMNLIDIEIQKDGYNLPIVMLQGFGNTVWDIKQETTPKTNWAGSSKYINL